ncbi:MAG: response regulator [Chloroflexota bacterium]
MTITNFDEFTDNVRDALAHLYDHVHLQTHPLTILVSHQTGLDQVTRAQKLRRLLVEAIEQLSPADGTLASAEASFSYTALCYRYMDGLSPEEIANLLGLSPRQVYRKLREAVEAVASLLWDQLHAAAELKKPAVPEDWDRQSLAQATVQQLSSLAHAEMLEIQNVMTGIVKDAQPYCQQIGLEIILTPPAAPLHIYADRTMLRQALLNLLTKSFDRFKPKMITIEFNQTPGRLHVTLLAQPEAGHAIALPRAGEPERIGWQIGVKLIELQGGQVLYGPSAENWGIEIIMPLIEPQRVLVIDDMPDIINLFQRFTARYALEVIGAKNGKQASEILQKITPSLILLDVMLPAQDGWEILQTLKSNPASADIPVVICSILNEPGFAAAIGANGYLRKPVSQEALLQELSYWFRLAPAPGSGQR